MAIDAHSTTAPADHRALLRGAAPVAAPALTAETIAMLDAIPPADGRDAKRQHGPACLRQLPGYPKMEGGGSTEAATRTE